MASDSGNGTYFTQGSHTYRLLGESGLVEDEEGNILNASDLSDPYSPQEQPSSKTGKVSSTDWMQPSPGKTAPSLWDYDPRYCGPDPYAWLEEMSKKEKEPAPPSQKRSQVNQEEEPNAATAATTATATTISTPPSTADNSESEPKPQVKIHLTKGTIVFLVIGTVALVAYFVSLIITLVEQIARLF